MISRKHFSTIIPIFLNKIYIFSVSYQRSDKCISPHATLNLRDTRVRLVNWYWIIDQNKRAVDVWISLIDESCLYLCYLRIKLKYLVKFSKVWTDLKLHTPSVHVKVSNMKTVLAAEYAFWLKFLDWYLVLEIVKFILFKII